MSTIQAVLVTLVLGSLCACGHGEGAVLQHVRHTESAGQAVGTPSSAVDGNPATPPTYRNPEEAQRLIQRFKEGMAPPRR